MDNIVIRTIVPILLLMGTGLVSRKLRILKSGDERILSAYLYYFALPALLFVSMSETDFTQENLRLMLAGIVPVLIVLTIYMLAYLLFKFSKHTLYLIILSTVFGSLAFFGIPFISFAFEEEGRQVATLAVASISIVSVAVSITTLELYRLKQSNVLKALRIVIKRLSRNPLVISIFSGIFVSLVRSLFNAEIPGPISEPLHMLGGTTSTVAIFMLGVFLHGRKYTNLGKAFKLSLLRIVFLPITAFLSTSLFQLSGIERPTLILMHGMPVAISMIVLSERYNFYKETIASLILISSLGAGIYLNLWLLLLGYY